MSRREEHQRRELVQKAAEWEAAASHGFLLIQEMEKEINITRDILRLALQDPRDVEQIVELGAGLSLNGQAIVAEVLRAAQ